MVWLGLAWLGLAFCPGITDRTTAITADSGGRSHVISLPQHPELGSDSRMGAGFSPGHQTGVTGQDEKRT